MCQRILLCLLLMFSLPATLFAATVQLPETGQTSCWDSAGNAILCTDPLGLGQDGAEKSGAAWPSPRFVDNGNGTVADNLTGLVWLKRANCVGAMPWANALTWSNALAHGACDLSDGSVPGDWRLPNDTELESLVNAQQPNSATWLNGQGFSNVQAVNYWSASTYAYNPAGAWYVSMSDGGVGANHKPNGNYVWPVRGGQ